jgi:hypothetical protein
LQNETYLLRLLPKSWRNYSLFALALSFGLYLLEMGLAANSGSLSTFLADPEWSFEPFYLITCLIALKLLYDIFARNLARIGVVFDVSDEELRRHTRVMGNSSAAILISVPFIGFDSYISLTTIMQGWTGALLVLTWDLEWLFIGSIVWFMVGVLVFFDSLNRCKLRGNRVEAALGSMASSIGGISWTLGAPVVLFEVVNTYYFFAASFVVSDLTEWAGTLTAFFIVLSLMGLVFVVPRVIVGRKVNAAKNQIESELAAKYAAYVDEVINGRLEFDSAMAEKYRGMRGLLDKRLKDRVDVVKGLLPVVLPIVNLALVYVVERGLGHLTL